MNVAMVPARVGSERLAEKNFLLINNQSLIDNSLELAILSGCFESVFLNGDSEIFRAHAESKSAEFHLRPNHLGSSDTPIDAVINEFLLSNDSITRLFLINPPSQLLTVDDIREFCDDFIEQNVDSMIATTSLSRHAQLLGNPINFVRDAPLARTQDLNPIEVFNYSIMAWRAEVYLDSYKKSGAGLMCGTFKTFENGIRNFLAIKNSEDFQMVKTLRESSNLQ
jgi:CMP-N-acetylneuraminic acid synthetase